MAYSPKRFEEHLFCTKAVSYTVLVLWGKLKVAPLSHPSAPVSEGEGRRGLEREGRDYQLLFQR